jgi:hypothetical protein
MGLPSHGEAAGVRFAVVLVACRIFSANLFNLEDAPAAFLFRRHAGGVPGAMRISPITDIDNLRHCGYG